MQPKSVFVGVPMEGLDATLGSFAPWPKGAALQLPNFSVGISVKRFHPAEKSHRLKSGLLTTVHVLPLYKPLKYQHHRRLFWCCCRLSRPCIDAATTHLPVASPNAHYSIRGKPDLKYRQSCGDSTFRILFSRPFTFVMPRTERLSR